MASREHLSILKQGAHEWNRWRHMHPEITPDLSGADLTLQGGFEPDGLARRIAASYIAIPVWTTPPGTIDLTGIDLRAADLRGAVLYQSWLPKAQLSHARLIDANLVEAYLPEADLQEADLRRANLAAAQLEGANLEKANLMGATLANTNLRRAILWGCRVYGSAVWGAQVDDASQSNLIISNEGEPTITVDDLEVAQFIYLLSRSEKLRKVIDTLGSKGVSSCGRFTKERLAVLHAIRRVAETARPAANHVRL